MSQEIVIIGGGISGLALAQNVLASQPDRQVTILEGSSRLGGRIYTQYKGLFEMGAKRVAENHTETIKLLKSLGLGDRLHFKNLFESGETAYLDGEALDNVNLFFTKLQLVNQLKQILGDSNPDKIYRKSTGEWLRAMGMSRQDLVKLEKLYGFSDEFRKSNAGEGLPYIISILDPDLPYSQVAGGLSELVDRLVSQLKRRYSDRLTIKTNCYIDQISYLGKKGFRLVNDESEKFQASALVMALPPHALQQIKMSGFPEGAVQRLEHLLERKVPTTLLRIYGVFHQPNLFRHCEPIITDLACRHVTPIKSENNQLSYAMLSYTDGPGARHLSQLLEQGRYRPQIKKWLTTLYPSLRDRLDPSTKLDIVHYLWEPAGYYTAPGSPHHLLNRELRQPFGKLDIPLYLVGDTYSDLPIWIEGSLRSTREVAKLLKRRETFQPMTPEMTSESRERGFKIKGVLNRIFRDCPDRIWSSQDILDDEKRDYLLVLGGYVLNVEKFVGTHPGGEAILRGCGNGQDWTRKFQRVQAHRGQRKLKRIKAYLSEKSLIQCLGRFK